MVLHADHSGSGRRLALVHGFTQTRRCWGPAADDLATDHEVVSIDAPGHGRSGHDDADLWEGAELLAGAGGVATYVGYSMGGRLCLHIALSHPEQVAGLVLLGATAGIEDRDERDARRRQDDDTAGRLEEQGLERFLDDWMQQPLFAGLPPEQACIEERFENRVHGLASSLRRAGTGAQEPTWSELHRLSMPVLVMAGEDDTKFRALAQRMAAEIGANATAAFVPGAGHTAHLEAPASFLATLRPWLARHDL